MSKFAKPSTFITFTNFTTTPAASTTVTPTMTRSRPPQRAFVACRATLAGLAAAAALGAGPLASNAQGVRLQAGLWEHSMQMQGAAGGQMEQAMAQMQQQLASMPPDQRKQVEAMMASRGVAVGGSGQTMTVKVCLSAEAAARNDMPQQSGCTQETLQRSSDGIKFRFTCVGPPPSRGEGEYKMSSPTSYSGRATVETQVNGKPERTEMRQSGRWLSADCGAIQPRQ